MLGAKNLEDFARWTFFNSSRLARYLPRSNTAPPFRLGESAR